MILLLAPLLFYAFRRGARITSSSDVGDSGYERPDGDA